MFPKDAFTIVTTNNGNNYLINHRLRQVLFLHPILKNIIDLINQGISVDNWIAHLPESGELSMSGYSTTRQDVERHFEFFRLLEENGYFKPVRRYELGDRSITGDIIRFHLANTQQMIFEVTEKCNLNCSYCGYGAYYNGYEPRTNKNMEAPIAIRALDYLDLLYGSPLSLQPNRTIAVSFYGGEPLLNMPLIEHLVNYVRGNKLFRDNSLFVMTTNGVLLDQYMDYLKENEFLLLISFDGNAENNGFRVFPNGKASFARVFANIRSLRDKYPDYFDRRVSFLSVLHGKNSPSAIRRFFKAHFNKDPLISRLNTRWIRPDKKGDFHDLFEGRCSETVSTDLESFPNDGDPIKGSPQSREILHFLRNHCGTYFQKYDHLLFPPQNEFLHVTTGTCLPFEKKFFVTAKGKILPCERINQKYSLGSILADGRLEIDFEGIARKYNNHYEKLGGLCQKCWGAGHCRNCFFFLDLEAVNLDCPDFRDERGFIAQIGQWISRIEEQPQYYTYALKDDEEKR